MVESSTSHSKCNSHRSLNVTTHQINYRQEIPTPDVVDHIEHLGGVTIPPLNKTANILLQIGKDVPDVHHVLEGRHGSKTVPFAQR